MSFRSTPIAVRCYARIGFSSSAGRGHGRRLPYPRGVRCPRLGLRRRGWPMADAFGPCGVSGAPALASRLSGGLVLRSRDRRGRVRQCESVAFWAKRHSRVRSKVRSRARFFSVEDLQAHCGHLATEPGRASRLPFAVGVAVWPQSGVFSPGLTILPTERRQPCPGRTILANGVPRQPGATLRKCRDGGIRACLPVARAAARTGSGSTRDFYLAVGFYGVQRFVLVNSSSPTARCSVRSPCFNLLSAAVFIYAIVMIATAAQVREAS